MVRCQAQPLPYEEDAVHWTILGASPAALGATNDDPDDAERLVPSFVLVGEFAAHSTEGVVAVTVEAIISHPNGSRASLDTERALLAEVRRVGAQLQDILYDTAAPAARQLLALTGIEVSVPTKTPAAEFELLTVGMAMGADEHEQEQKGEITSPR